VGVLALGVDDDPIEVEEGGFDCRHGVDNL
jgi:hypothetical protein